MSRLEELQNRDLAEEIEAINAIYEPDTITVTATSQSSTISTLDLGLTGPSSDHTQTTIILQIPGQSNLSFRIGFAPAYPETRPVVLGTASTAARGEGKIAVDVLEDIVQRTWQPGTVCLFDLISEAVEVFPELNIGGDKEEATSVAADSSTTTTTTRISGQAVTIDDKPTLETTDSFATLSLRNTFGLDSPPDWVLSDVVTEKKSIFLGRAVRVTSSAQVQAYLEHLTATDKKAAVATHNISAWRIKEKRNESSRAGDKANPDTAETQTQDYDDDGESAAGGRLLHVMQMMDVWNVLVVVSRWYGGIHLGPARFRLINDVGRDALVKSGRMQEGSTSEKGKKKPRR